MAKFLVMVEKNKKTEVEKKERESVLSKLQQHKQESAEQQTVGKKVDKKKD